MAQPVAGVPSGLLLLIKVQPSLCSWATVLSGDSKPSFKEAAAACDNDREYIILPSKRAAYKASGYILHLSDSSCFATVNLRQAE